MNHISAIDIMELLPAVKAKLLHGDRIRWSEQRLGLKQDPKNASFTMSKDEYGKEYPLTNQKWIDHFRGNPLKASTYSGWKYYVGSIGLYCTFTDSRVKWFCADCDSAEVTQAMREQFLPVLDKYGIQYIWEEAGRGERAHIWFFVDTTVWVMKAFTQFLLNEAGIDRLAPPFKLRRTEEHDGGQKLELYPAFKSAYLMRLMGGNHLRVGYVHPIHWRGEISNDPLFIMQAIIDCPVFTEEQIIKICPAATDERHHAHDHADILAQMPVENKLDPTFLAARSSGDYIRKKPFIYDKLRLKPAVDKLPEHLELSMPPFVSSLIHNCLAFKRSFNDIVRRDRLEDTGIDVHLEGLWWHSVMEYSDRVINKNQTRAARDWGDEFFPLVRVRDAGGHNWDSVAKLDENFLIPSCKKMCEELNMCHGCPFFGQDNFTNPRQFWWGTAIKRQIEDKIRLDTSTNIRREITEKLHARVYELLKSGRLDDIFLVPDRGVGKSVAISNLAVKLARSKVPVIISCGNGQIAMEHKTRIEKEGIECNTLMGYENTFEYLTDIVCPDSREITELQDAGYGRSTIKRKYCDSCPFRTECPYPDQYKDLAEKERYVTIVQHAHFSAPEARRQIMQKHYRVMFVDEDPMNSVSEFVKATDNEIAAYEAYADVYPELGKLLKWFEGNKPNGRLNFSKTSRDELKELFCNGLLPYNLPQYISTYNRGATYRKLAGVHMFSPLPQKMIRVFANATLNPFIMAAIIGRTEDYVRARMIGNDVHIDPRACNPKNTVTKVVNCTGSKSFWEKSDTLLDVLDVIALEAKTKYHDKTVLVTVFKDQVRKTVRYLKEKHGLIRPRVSVNHLQVGTNEWARTNVQYLLCAPHFNAKQIAFEVWRIKDIMNFWADRRGDERMRNPFRARYVQPLSSIPVQTVPVRLLMRANTGSANLVSLRTIVKVKKEKRNKTIVVLPEEKFAYNVTQTLIAQTEQGCRIRLNEPTSDDEQEESTERHIVVFPHYEMHGMVHTGLVTLEQFLARTSEEQLSISD